MLKDGPKIAYHGDLFRSSTKESHSIELNGVGKASGYTENADETSVAKVGLGAWGLAKMGAQNVATTKSNNATNVANHASDNGVKLGAQAAATKQAAQKVTPTVLQPGQTAVFPP